MKLKFNPTADDDYGIFTCEECGNCWHGGGPAIHKKTCSQKDDSRYSRIIGPNVIKAVVKWAEKNGDKNSAPNIELCLDDIKEQLPEVLNDFTSHG